MNGTTATVRVKVELFGTPRIQAGTGEVELAVPYPANRRNLVSALAEEVPHPGGPRPEGRLDRLGGKLRLQPERPGLPGR